MFACARDFSEKDDARPLFIYNSFEKWLERQKIPPTRVRDPKKTPRDFPTTSSTSTGLERISNRVYVPVLPLRGTLDSILRSVILNRCVPSLSSLPSTAFDSGIGSFRRIVLFLGLVLRTF